MNNKNTNYWTELSIEFANQRNYLDELFKIYPTIPEGIRDIDNEKWDTITEAFNNREDALLLDTLLALPLFPIKDSYIAYLKKDSGAVQRNPETIKRITGRIYEMGLDKLYERASEPKETNRQIGPLFSRWVKNKTLGLDIMTLEEFKSTSENAILDGSDRELMLFAKKNLGYAGNKGLDFIARMRGKYVVGEAKFLTDFGGHQNAQFEDAKNVLRDEGLNAIKIAILDGVLYINGKNKMHKYITENQEKYNIMSALVLREFLYQIK